MTNPQEPTATRHRQRARAFGMGSWSWGSPRQLLLGACGSRAGRLDQPGHSRQNRACGVNRRPQTNRARPARVPLKYRIRLSSLPYGPERNRRGSERVGSEADMQSPTSAPGRATNDQNPGSEARRSVLRHHRPVRNARQRIRTRLPVRTDADAAIEARREAAMTWWLFVTERSPATKPPPVCRCDARRVRETFGHGDDPPRALLLERPRRRRLPILADQAADRTAKRPEPGRGREAARVDVA